jgi:glutaredoxin
VLGDWRSRLNDLLSSDDRDRHLWVRVARRVANAANDALGAPICSPTELDHRRGRAAGRTRARDAAPVLLYVTWDSVGRPEMEALLKLHHIEYRVLPVDRDDVQKSYLQRVARREPPVVFIGADPVGGLDELKALAASGDLERRVFGGEPGAAGSNPPSA